MPSPGLRIGDYTLERRVASGTTCEVYEARRDSVAEPVAVKCLRHELCGIPELVGRFFNEAHLLHELRHPHLVRAFEWGAAPDGPPYMVLEWLPLDLSEAL